jgi:hypothetical protein
MDRRRRRPRVIQRWSVTLDNPSLFRSASLPPRRREVIEPPESQVSTYTRFEYYFDSREEMERMYEHLRQIPSLEYLDLDGVDFQTVSTNLMASIPSTSILDRANMNSIQQAIANAETTTVTVTATAEETTMIPCEVCSDMIPFHMYTQHIDDCLRRRQSHQQQQLQSNTSTFIGVINPTTIAIPATQTGIMGLLSMFVNNIDSYEQNLALQEQLGRVRIGVDNKDTVTTVVEPSSIDDCELCSICLESLKDAAAKGTVIRSTVCKHMFCQPCLFRWLDENISCPNCTQSVEAYRIV